MNSSSIYIYRWYSSRSKEKNSWFFRSYIDKAILLIGHLYHYHQVKVTCTSSVLKEHIHWFIIMSIIISIIFRQCMSYIEHFLFYKYITSTISSSRNILLILLIIIYLFLCLLNRIHWDIVPLLFHSFHFSSMDLDF